MLSSRRYSLHLERSTGVGNIGSSFNPGLRFDDGYTATAAKKKFRPQPAIVHSKQAVPPVAEIPSCVLAANLGSKDEEQHSTRPWPRPRPRVIEGISFVGSPERELSAAKKIAEDDELGLFGEFIKKCTLCKKELKPDKDVYMYSDRPFCSSDCRDDRIALDGFSRKDFGLGKEDQKTMKSLRKDLNQLQMYL